MILYYIYAEYYGRTSCVVELRIRYLKIGIPLSANSNTHYYSREDVLDFSVIYIMYITNRLCSTLPTSPKHAGHFLSSQIR